MAIILPENFKFPLRELVDKQSFIDYGEGCWNFFPQDSIDMLHGIRTYFNLPITINSWPWGGGLRFRGYRGPSCTVGAPGSYHRSGRAWDFDVKGMTAEQVRIEIKANQDNEHLKLIQRMEKKVTWVHVDTKPTENRIYLFNP